MDAEDKTPGLKIISRQVMQAVSQFKSTTYKQVANIVSGQSSDLLAPSSGKLAKQEKNLRRRVYDSLNVLYAVGVLGKGKHKQVFITDSSAVPPPDDLLAQLAAEERELGAAKGRLGAKRKRLVELVRQQLCYKRVVKRNEKALAKSKLRMPFLLVCVPQEQSHAQVRFYSEHRLQLVSERAFSCLGDVDVLIKMGLEEVCQAGDLALLGAEFGGLGELFVQAERLI